MSFKIIILKLQPYLSRSWRTLGSAWTTLTWSCLAPMTFLSDSWSLAAWLLDVSSWLRNTLVARRSGSSGSAARATWYIDNTNDNKETKDAHPPQQSDTAHHTLYKQMMTKVSRIHGWLSAKTAVTPLLTHWNYCSLALSHWNDSDYGISNTIVFSSSKQGLFR